MECLREQIEIDIATLSYLEKLDEKMIWDSYKEVVPLAMAEIVHEKYQPATIQLLNRFNGRLILEIRKSQAAAATLGSVSRQEFEELKSMMRELAVKCEKYDEQVGKLESQLVSVQADNAKLQDRIKQLDEK